MDVGTHVDDNCTKVFNELKLGKSSRYILYKLDSHTQTISVDDIGPRDATYADFVKVIPANESRFAVFDYSCTTDDNPPRNIEKLVFIFWSPDTQQVKQKMAYASGKEALKKKLTGLGKDLQANDLSELDEKEIKKLVLG